MRFLVGAQDPKYGYGEAGSFSFPAVPPSAQLVYEVEFVDFEDVNTHEDTVRGAVCLGGFASVGAWREHGLRRRAGMPPAAP